MKLIKQRLLMAALGIMVAVFITACGDEDSGSGSWISDVNNNVNRESGNVNLNTDDTVLNEEKEEELTEDWYIESAVVQSYFARKNLVIQSLTINDTETDDDEQTVYVHIVSENDVARLSINYGIQSEKSDNGSWEVTRIYAEEREIYEPISTPEADISFDDSDVIIDSIEEGTQGDDILYIIYYTRVFDGKVACIKESYYRTYYFDTLYGDGWKEHEPSDDSYLDYSCELKISSGVYEVNDEMGTVHIDLQFSDNSLNIADLQATISGEEVSLCDEKKYYSDMEMEVDFFIDTGINHRIKESPCANDYVYEFVLYQKGWGGGYAGGDLIITPDGLWLQLDAYETTMHEYCLIGK